MHVVSHPEADQELEAAAPVIVWLRSGNSSNQALRQWFLPQLSQIVTWIEQGTRVVEIR